MEDRLRFRVVGWDGGSRWCGGAIGRSVVVFEHAVVDAGWVIWWRWSERGVDAERCLVDLGCQEGHHLH